MFKHLQRRLFTGTALALGLAATLGAWTPAASAQTVADIKKKGELTVGMLVDFPPYGTMNSSNQPDGYDADVARQAGAVFQTVCRRQHRAVRRQKG